MSDAASVALVVATVGILAKQPYLTVEEIVETLAEDGTSVDEEDVGRKLAQSPFFRDEPRRWFLDANIAETWLQALPDDDEVDQRDDETHLAFAMLAILAKRPYLTAKRLRARLNARGWTVSKGVVNDLLWEYDFFRPEPKQWYLDLVVPWLEELDKITKRSDEHAVATDTPAGDADLDSSDLLWFAGPQPRDWQWQALLAWIGNGQHGIVEAVTGTGKTLIGILAAGRAVARGQSVVIAVPSLDLVDQWAEAAGRWLPELSVGQLGGNSHDTVDECDILITTAASGSKYQLHSDERESLLIADEVHGYGAPQRRLVLEDEFEHRLGLTATLERDNDEGVEEVLLPYFDRVVHSYTYADGLRDGVLAPFKIGFIGVQFLPDEQDEYDDLGREMGRIRHRLEERGLHARTDKQLFAEIARLSKDKGADFQDMRLAQKFMSNLSQRKQMQAQATNKIQAIGALAEPLEEATRALVFTETIGSASAVAAILDEQGVLVSSYDSSYSRPERQEILESFRDGDVTVLCAPKVLDEGVDVPDADVGVIVAASRSRRQMIQRMGRIVRPNAGGHPSTFFILYIEGTREDPRKGAHEGFLEEVQPHATEVTYFSGEDIDEELVDWMLSDR